MDPLTCYMFLVAYQILNLILVTLCVGCWLSDLTVGDGGGSCSRYMILKLPPSSSSHGLSGSATYVSIQ
jgi:hypothetical protein